MMKWKMLIGISVGAIVISAGYLLYNKMNEKDDSQEFVNKEKKENISVKHPIEKKVETVQKNDVVNAERGGKTVEDTMKNLNESKTELVKGIKERHEKAVEIMREALNNITSEQAYTESENKEILDEMNSQLDDLLD